MPFTETLSAVLAIVRLKDILAALLLMVLTITCIFFYRKSILLDIKNDQLHREVAEISSKLTDAVTAFDSLQLQVAKIQNLKEDFDSIKVTVTEQHNLLHQTLFREERKKKSLRELSLAKPNLIEIKINRASEKYWKSLEDMAWFGEKH